MPPRLPLRPPLCPASRLYATASTVQVSHPTTSPPPIARHAPTQPPSHRAATSRKTLLHRTYLSILRSTPLLLLFQHNNFRAIEWTALRRELSLALRKADAASGTTPIEPHIKLISLQSGVFASAVRVAEFYDRSGGTAHGTSREAYEATIAQKKSHLLGRILTGPMGALTFPVVSPAHLKVVLELLFPENHRPKRGLDPLAVSGLQKLVLLAARVDGDVAGGKSGEGRVLDESGIRWVSGLGGVVGLRSELVAMLRNAGGGDLVRNLESVGIGLARTVEGRRKMLDEEANGGVAADGSTEGGEVKEEVTP